jgi:hypothetical protein
LREFEIETSNYLEKVESEKNSNSSYYKESKDNLIIKEFENIIFEIYNATLKE